MSNNLDYDARACLPPAVLEQLETLQAVYETWINHTPPAIHPIQGYDKWNAKEHELRNELNIRAAGLIGACVGTRLLPPTETLEQGSKEDSNGGS